MRAVKPRAFAWAGMVAVAGLEPRFALAAAVLGLLLALVPALFAPRLVPVQDENGTHAGTSYVLHGPTAPQLPSNPTPERPYTNGSGY